MGQNYYRKQNVNLLDSHKLINTFNKTDKERSGIIKINKNKNGNVELSAKVNKIGNEDSVVIDDLREPSVHNHPLDGSGCSRINGDCGLQPPSSSDMKVYAESPVVHVVVTKFYTYYIKRTKRLNKRMVERCYKLLENYYDKIQKPHSFYENMWLCLTKLTGWFYVLRCKNANCKYPVHPSLLQKLFK